jgi:hypothetical protein
MKSAIRGLVPDDVLMRALLNQKARINLPDAFMLRHDERDTGLSVHFDCTPEECRANFKRTYGVLGLTVRNVTELALRVVPDGPKHANILDIPYKDDDPARAEHLASQLAARAAVLSDGRVETASGS